MEEAKEQLSRLNDLVHVILELKAIPSAITPGVSVINPANSIAESFNNPQIH